MTSKCPSRFSLVRWQTGELPSDDRNPLTDHIAGCPLCSAIVEELRLDESHCADRRELILGILEARINSVEPVSGNVEPSFWSSWGRLLVPAGGIAAVVLVVLFAVLLGDATPPVAVDPGEIRFKGEVALKVMAQRGDHRFELDGTQVLRAGDQLSFSVTTGSVGFVAVYVVTDSQTAITVVPRNPSSSQPGKAHALPSAGLHRLEPTLFVEAPETVRLLTVVFADRDFDPSGVREQMVAELGRGISELSSGGWCREPYTCDVVELNRTQ